MITKTDAVVLHTRRYSESSKIVTLFTREHGKMSVIAHGAMQMKNKFGSVLQTLSYLSTVIYVKETRELQNLSHAEPIERFPRLIESLERMTAGMVVVVLVNASLLGEYRNEELFQIVVETLRALNTPATNEYIATLWFMAQLTANLGYAVRTEECGITGEPLAVSGPKVPYSVTLGAPLSDNHRDSAPYRMISLETFHLLQDICRTPGDQLSSIQSSDDAIKEGNDLMGAFVKYHVDGLRRLNVNAVMAKLVHPLSTP